MSRKAFYTLSHRDITEPLSGVYFQKPKIVSILAHDKDHQMALLERMKYFRFPERSRFPLDLNKGIESYIYRDGNAFYNKGINKIAYYIMHRNEFNLADDEEVVDEDLQHEVVTSRGTLLDLMAAPYMYKRQWEKILVTRFKNKLFIHAHSPNEKKDAKSTWHFKLHQYCFSDDPEQEPDTNKPVDVNDQLYCIYKSKRKNLKFLYSGEMNGIISDEKLTDLHDWNELNQKRFVFTKFAPMNTYGERQKMLRLWCKSYLSAVNDLYIGYTTEKGLVFKLDYKLASELANEGYWKPQVCITFLYKFLSLILEEMKDVNCPYTTYVFSKDFGNNTIYLDIHEGKTEHSFLTEDFIEHLEK